MKYSEKVKKLNTHNFFESRSLHYSPENGTKMEKSDRHHFKE